MGKDSQNILSNIKIVKKLLSIAMSQSAGAADPGAALSICNLKFNVPNEILVVFHNGSNYDYYFIIKELANQF